MDGGTFFKVGGTSSRQKNYRKILWFELATVTSQALKYGVITCTPYEGLNYIILEKITPAWKRIGKSPEIQIGYYRGDPGQQRHASSSYTAYSDGIKPIEAWVIEISICFLSGWHYRCTVTLVTWQYLRSSHDNFSIVEQRTSQSNDSAIKSSAY